MIEAARHAREQGIPYLGICLGMQIAAIEFARSVLHYEDADSSELDPDTEHPVIDLMPDQEQVDDKGGTMRLGAYPCRLREGSRLFGIYASVMNEEGIISERHRHRYEFNTDYEGCYEDAGMKLAGRSPDGRLVEAIELSGHPFYIGVQYHPEFKSRPQRPHPLFFSFLEAAVAYRSNISEKEEAL